MNFEEFIKPEEFIQSNNEVEASEPDELDVQRTVVEALAADKAEQDEQIAQLRAKNQELLNDNEELKDQIVALKDLIERFKQKDEDILKKSREADEKIQKVSELEQIIGEQRTALANVGEVLSKNSEKEESNQVALLDRNVELDDRFVGETRDHVLEVLREARDAAEKDGRIRRAQLIESVLVANEPVGELAKRRQALERLFSENGNILSGVVIAALEKNGISHKNGDEYLMPAEIIKRTY